MNKPLVLQILESHLQRKKTPLEIYSLKFVSQQRLRAGSSSKFTLRKGMPNHYKLTPWYEIYKYSEKISKYQMKFSTNIP